MAKRLQSPIEKKLRLILLFGNQPDDVLIQSRRRGVGLHIRDKPVLVLLLDKAFDGFGCCTHTDESFLRSGTRARRTAWTSSVDGNVVTCGLKASGQLQLGSAIIGAKIDI